MRTTIQFRNLEGFDHMKSYVENSIDQVIGKFESWRQFNTQVMLGMARPRSVTHKPIFECGVLLKGKELRRPIFVKKSNSNFYRALSSTLKAMEKILRRASRARESIRRRSGLHSIVKREAIELNKSNSEEL